MLSTVDKYVERAWIDHRQIRDLHFASLDLPLPYASLAFIRPPAPPSSRTLFELLALSEFSSSSLSLPLLKRSVLLLVFFRGMAPADALSMYARKRTVNQKGVTIASQRRYVCYVEKLTNLHTPSAISQSFTDGRSGTEGILSFPGARSLRRIRLHDVAGKLGGAPSQR